MSENNQNYTSQIGLGVFLGGAGLLACWFIVLPILGILLLLALLLLVSIPWDIIKGIALLGAILYVIALILTRKKTAKPMSSQFYSDRSK